MAVTTREFHFTSSDGKTNVYAHAWLPAEENIRFLFQISHGMADYVARYNDFACYLSERGGAVYGNDHLGHGRTTPPGEPYGYFGRKHGDELVVRDMHTLTEIMRSNHPGIPCFLFGHSMGSLLARDYCTKYGKEIEGAIYSGTSGANKLTGLVRFLACVGFVFGRRKKPAKLLSHLAFSKYNARIENPKTPNDWLTRDDTIVDKYNKDPWNTFLFTDQAAYDFATLVDRVSGEGWAEALPKGIPYLVISGEMDPVGDYGRGVEEVFNWMREADIPDITLKIYPGSRHELTNELNREEVFADILSWIETRQVVALESIRKK